MMESLPGQLEELKVSKIHPSKRALRDQIGPLEELIASISEKGLLQPIVVRPVSGGFEIIAGNRRLSAYRRLRWNKIPCHIVDLDDKEAYEVSLTENLQRKTLDPIEEAEALKKYVDEYGFGGVSELARRIGKSQEYVSKRMQLLDLPSSIREEVIRRRISPTVAEELRPLSGEDLEIMTKAITQQHLSSRKVRNMVKLLRAERGDSKLLGGFDIPDASPDERRLREIDVALRRCSASLKICLLGFDEALNYLDEDYWIAREIIGERRMKIHQEVDALIRLRKRIGLLPNLIRSRGKIDAKEIELECRE